MLRSDGIIVHLISGAAAIAANRGGYRGVEARFGAVCEALLLWLAGSMLSRLLEAASLPHVPFMCIAIRAGKNL